MKFTIAEVVAATRGVLVQGSLSRTIKGVSTNSKTVKRGELFIAIQGKRFDAHDFISEVVQKGVKAVAVSRGDMSCPAGIAVIRVEDTTRALGDLARAHRKKFSVPVIAVTGSAGKTTTKEMIAAILRSRYRVLKNAGTENNQFGVPLTVLKMKPSHDAVVLEVGTNSPGDIAWLTSIACPTIAVMTNIGESHLELLKTPADVFKEKLNLVKGLPREGTVVVNADDPYLRKIRGRSSGRRCVTYGVNRPADFRAGGITMAHNRLEFTVNASQKMTLAAPVPANICNALAAVSCGRIFKVSWRDIKRRLRHFSFQPGRQAFKKAGEIWLIDDTYNANPVSFRAALKTLSLFKTEGRKILVCGDMLELGDQSQPLHEEAGAAAAQIGLDCVISFGNFSRWITKTVRERNPAVAVRHCATPDEVERALRTCVRPSDVVLVKGSRGMKMERFVEFLINNDRKSC